MIGQLTIRADVLHTLLMGSIAAGPGAIPLTAIITGPRNTVVPDARLVDSRRSCWFHWEMIGLGNVEPLDFTEIIAPVGKTRFDAVQHGSVKQNHGIQIIF